MTHICKPKVADEGTAHYARLCDGSEMQEGDVTVDTTELSFDYCEECLNECANLMEVHP